MDNTDEENELVRQDPDMAYAFQAQDDVLKLMAEWIPKLAGMTEVQRSRHWWAAADVLLCTMYRVLPKAKADGLIQLIMTEIRAGRG